jgi:hypothetical protein
LFKDLRAQIQANLDNASNNEISFPEYFATTPWHVLSKLDVPITIYDETRFAGMWVVAPQGMGKTTLLHNLIAEDLEKNGSLILMDSKGDLIQPYMNDPKLASRRIIIGPDHLIGINPLDIRQLDMNKAVDNLEYLFSSLLDFKLTATQSMVLKVVFRTLITTFPNPTLANFQELMADDGPKKYLEYLKKLEPDLQQFFTKEFYTENIRGRRQEVLQRLRLLLEHDLLRTMLMAPKTTFHIAEAMDRGKIIIINNSRGRLGNKGAEFLGRYFIAQVLAAAQERSFRRSSEKTPVYFYIDECHTVVAQDERITDVLHECRSQKIALAMAHQETTQVSEKVLSALQNCAIRFAHPDEEARKLSGSLRLDLKQLRSLRKGQFAAYIRGLSDSGMVVNVPKSEFTEAPAYTDDELFEPGPSVPPKPRPASPPSEPSPAPDRSESKPETPEAPAKKTPPPEERESGPTW